MMGDRTSEVRAVFTAAAALDSPEERARYLDDACLENPDLRRRVEELLRAHDRDHPYLTKGGDPEPGSVQEGPGTVIGHYKILQEIGEGGFGMVFMAEQVEPVRRKVALKVVKPGMDSREVIARFEAERQALALMDHPNIAKVFDAGTTESGRPYFVMELVCGPSVTGYCDEHNLPVAERLEIFTHVCHALQHAHQKGVIHRDLKPSNILVTRIDGMSVPKVIDFGVAKALGQQLTEKTLFTAFQQMVGTPAYMSPEQTAQSGTDVDTRSDVYSLGVLLYELLTGATPLDVETLHRAGLDEVRRLIRETEPRKPSTRLRSMGEDLAEVARRRHTEPSTLTRFVHGDLDWIVMKALEKDRSRRYQTISALAEDIERHLANKPVRARSPGVLYRARKFVRRHKVGAGFTATAAAAVLLCVATLAYGLVQTRQERDRAEEEAAVSTAVNAFLLEDLLAQASPEIQPNRDLKLRDLIDHASTKAGERFHKQPMLELRVRLTLLSVYRDLGELKNARRELKRVKEICRQKQLSGEDPTWLGVRHAEGRLLLQEGKSAEAQKLYEDLLPIWRSLLDPEHQNILMAMNNLALANLRQGEPEDAQKLCEELLPIWKRIRGPGDLSTLKTTNIWAHSFLNQGKPAEARKIFEDVLLLWRQEQGPEHPGTLMTMNALAQTCLREDKPAEAQELCDQVLEVMPRRMGPDHPLTLTVRNNLAVAYLDQGKHAEAQELCEKLLKTRRRVQGPEHPGTILTMCNLATSYSNQGMTAEAQKTYEDILKIQQKVLRPDHPHTLETIRRLEAIRQQQGSRQSPHPGRDSVDAYTYTDEGPVP